MNRGVAATVRLLHRRRGWTWTTAASVVLFPVAAGVTGALNPGPSPGGADVAVGSVFILVLAVLTAAGLATMVADTVRLRRARTGVSVNRPGGGPRTIRSPRTRAATRRGTA